MTTVEGWVAPGWEGVRSTFKHNFDSGSEVGAAFAAYHKGAKVVDLWGGVADATTGRPWSEDTMVLVYSTTKGFTAMCANRLADEGALDVDAPVCEYWPEFAQAGKEKITVADLLSHRAGLAWVDGTMTVDEMLAWDPVIKALESQAPSWTPRTAHGYHATTYGWLVGEVVRRVSGRSLGTFLRDEIAGPLDADCFVGLPAAQEPRVARLVQFSAAELSQMAELAGSPKQTQRAPSAPATAPDSQPKSMIETAFEFLGRDAPLVKALTAPGGALGERWIWDTPKLHAAELPAANGICDARAVARLYGSCVSDVDTGSNGMFRVLSPKQLDRALVQQTEGPDSVLMGLDIQWGLGFMLNRGMIEEAKMGGPRAFGHFGMGGSIGWADPDSELAIGYVMNKMSLGTTGDPRGFALAQACVAAARNG
ncbi:MAG: serine hydrolase domain-containing protein [Acidimicrobiales bacterium]